MKTTKNIRTISLFFLMTGLLTINSCNLRCLRGNGDVTSETRDVSNFSELEISSALKVVYTQSPTYKVEVIADDNLIGYITTEVHGNELQVDIKNRRCFNKVTKAEIHISAPSIEKIDISGASEFESTNTMSPGNLSLKASGASRVSLSSQTTGFTGEISGASEIEVSGSSNTLYIDESGASVFNAGSLLTKTATIELSGASSATVNVKNSLNAELSGASNLEYYGSPTVSSSTSGSSTINKK
jgi:uncharacterized protein with beta-barrel porin domain